MTEMMHLKYMIRYNTRMIRPYEIPFKILVVLGGPYPLIT